MENALALVSPTEAPQDDAYLTKLIGYYTEAMEASQTAREKAERDRDYYDNKQLTDAEYAALQARGQPPITLNIIRSRVEYMLGLEKKQRGDPKGYPRNPEDQPAADAFTDGMRFVVDQSDYHAHRSAVWKNVFIEGCGGLEWTAVPKPDGDVEITCIQIPWDRLIYDPHSTKTDFSDAAYVGQVIWLDLEEAVERAVSNGAEEGEARAKLESTLGFIDLGDTYDDKPKWSVWSNRQRKRVRIVNLWHVEQGRWRNCEFTKGGLLWEMDGPYATKDGESYCPYSLASGYVDRDNNRYGTVRDFIDPQDEVNKRRSKALHLISVNGVIADAGAVENVEKTRRELARPDFYIEKNPQTDFEIVKHGDLAAGQAALGQQAMDYVMNSGANNALQGRVDPNQSGKAIEAQQAGGLIELGDQLDNLRRFDRRSFKIIAWMMQQFWTAEKWIRVTDDDLNPQYVGLNVPQWQDAQTGMTGTEEDWGEVMSQGHQPMLQPTAPKNNVPELDVDIIVAESPDTIYNGPEEYQALVQLFSVPGIPPHIQRLMIEAHPGLTTRKKKQLLDMLEQSSQQPDPMQALNVEKAQADTEKTKAEGFRAMAQGEEIASRQMIPQPMPMDPAQAGMM